MAWIYNQTTGEMSHRGTVRFTGYSGAAPHQNDGSVEHVPSVGPIPKGWYSMRRLFNSPNVGRKTIELVPIVRNTAHGRTDFRIHGDSSSRFGNASEGCIILGKPEWREEMWNSGDHMLLVR